MKNIKKLMVLIIGSLPVLQGCSSFNVDDYLPDKKVEYKKADTSGRDLEMPPDLTNVRAGSELYVPGTTGASGTATYSDFLNSKKISSQSSNIANSNVMPTVENVGLKREGDQRWLVIESTPQLVWPNVVSFWQENGILLIEQDPTVGIMKTGWLENRADIASDFITNSIRRVFDGIYSAATRDQYRVRLEEGEKPGTTEVYLTHFGMEEQFAASSGSNDTDRTVWIPRGTDVSLEAEMLRRLMIHLGVKEGRAESLVAKKAEQRKQRSNLVKNANETKLIVKEGFARSWRLAGLALDRVGFAVEDRDRSSGIYYVRYNDPMADVETDESWLSKLKFWDGGDVEEDARYQIFVQSGATTTEIIVMDPEGNKLLTDTAARILTLIHEQIQ